MAEALRLSLISAEEMARFIQRLKNTLSPRAGGPAPTQSGAF